MLLLAVAGGVVVGLDVARTFRLVQWMPVKCLLWSAQGHDIKAQQQAVTELLDRMTRNTLSDRQWAAVVDVALTQQENVAIPWLPEWGDLIEFGRQRGKVDDPRWDRYIDQGMSNYIELLVRPKVRLGDPLPYRLCFVGGRVAYGSQITMQCTMVETRLGGIVCKNHMREIFGDGSDAFSLNDRAEDDGSFEAADVPPVVGKKECTVTWRCIAGERQPALNGAPVARVTRNLVVAKPFEVVPPSQSTVYPLHDPSKSKAIRDGMAVELVLPPHGDGYIYGIVDVRTVQVPISFTVELIYQGKKHTLGEFNYSLVWGNGSFEMGLKDAATVLRLPTTRKLGDTVGFAKIELRPDPLLATKSPDMTTFWGDTVTFDHVPIRVTDDPVIATH